MPYPKADLVLRGGPIFRSLHRGMVDALAALFDDPTRLAAMGEAARALAVENAADRIADLVERLEEAA